MHCSNIKVHDCRNINRNKKENTNIFKGYEISMNVFKTQAYLNILQLGSYDVLISMDSLEKYEVILNCYDKTFTYVDDNGNIINIKGIPRTISFRKISTLQIKRCVRKGCKVFVVHVIDNEKEENKKDIENFLMLQEFQDVFQEIHGLPPKRDR